GDGDLGAGGRVPPLWFDAAPPLRQDACGSQRGAAHCDDRGAPEEGDGLLPIFPYAAGARAPCPYGPRRTPQRAVRDRRQPHCSFVLALEGRPAAPAIAASAIDVTDRA